MSCHDYLWIILAIYGVSIIMIWLIEGSPPWNKTIVSDSSAVVGAIDTLEGLGFSSDEAASRVLEAARSYPEADYNELVNYALRCDEDKYK